MKYVYAAIAALIMSLAGTGLASADDITADVLTYNGETKVATAKGNVVIHANEGAVITGADGAYHFDDRSADLSGGVHYEKGNSTMDADTLHLAGDKTLTGTGSVVIVDGDNQRTIKGDKAIYNSDTGYSRVEGNAYVSTPDGSLTAPLIDGNLKEIRLVATGGVQFESETQHLTGSGDQAVYTRSPGADDGKIVLTGNASANQNGNSFYGPELIFTMDNSSVRTNGRSTLVITNTSGT